MTKIFHLILIFCLMFVSGHSLASETTTENDIADQFVDLFFASEKSFAKEYALIADNWKPTYTPMAIEMMSLSRGELVYLFNQLLKDKTGQSFGPDTNQWFVWWWQQPQANEPSYAKFKSRLYGLIDEKFKNYFDVKKPNTIRLDEVRWGGVLQDGIPPLRQPKMINADQAEYLDDDNVVFGIKINGDARAYPKRILAWHEMFVDEIGGEKFAGVYCTLCGAVILYKTVHDGVEHHLGTSGFLYRSNKLMYDRDTQSLWNTTWGEPVIGPLVDRDIRLERSYLVTTTWAEWKRRHPETTVLSLETGYQRDYGEGVAYNQYFATDDLMFSISTSDTRLKNKDEVLALTFPQVSHQTMAIAADFLADNPVYHGNLEAKQFVVFTDDSGANRVYETGGKRFQSYDLNNVVTDSEGRQWQLSEDGLSHDNLILARLPAHRAFWFGWHSAFPDTVLIK